MTHSYHRRTSKIGRLVRSVKDNLAFYCLVLLMIAAAVVLVMDLKPTPTVVPQQDQKEKTEQVRTGALQDTAEKRLAAQV